MPASFYISSDRPLACDGDQVTITTTGAEWLSYAWYINDDPVSGQTGRTLATALPDGSNSIYTIATSANGCSISSDIITVDAWAVKTDVQMAVAPISECEVEGGAIDLYGYLTGNAGDLELLKDPNNAKQLKFRFEGMQVGYNATAYHVASFANNPAKPDGSPYALTFSVWQENVPECVHTYERNVKVLPRPAAFAITASGAVACNEDTAFITASNSGIQGLTYRWRVNGAARDGVAGASLPKSALNDGINTIGVAAVNADGCATASVNTIDIKLAGFNPAVRFKDALAYCQNSGILTLSDLIEGADKQLMLNGTGGYTYSVTSNPLGLFTKNNLGVYSVDPKLKAADDYLITLVMNNGECEVHRTATLTILPVPAAFTVAASATNVVCNSDAVVVTASNSGVSGLTYQWYVNNALVSGVTGAELSKNYLSQGGNEVYTIATNSSGCAVRSDNTATTTLHTLAPEVEFSAASYAYCANNSKLSLHNLLTGADKSKALGNQEGMTYEITSSPTGLSVDNSYGAYELDPAQSTPQMYTITLWVRRNGCAVSRTATLSILPVPAAFTVAASTSNVVCNSDAVVVTASNSGVSGLTYQWYVNSTAVSGVSGAELSKSYLSQGGNEVYTIATNSSGCAVRSDNTATTTLHTLAPAVEFSAASYAYCANNGSFSLHNLLTGADKSKVLNRQESMTYEFTYTPTGLNLNSLDEVDPAQSTPQTYTVTLYVRRNGCEVHRTATLTILPIPAAFTVTASTSNVVCNSDAVVVTASNSGVSGLTYQWYVNNALVDDVSGASLAKSYLSQGGNEVYTIATNSSGCAVRSDNTAVTTLHTLAPVVEFSEASYAYCANDAKLSLHDLLTGADKSKVLGNQEGMTYEITSSPTGLSVSNTFGDYRVDPVQSTPQAYTVTLTVRRNGCEITKTATLVINVAPSPFNISTTKPSTVIDGATVYLLCNSSAFDATTTALANTASVEWYLGADKITTTTQESYTYTIGSDQRVQVSAVAVSSTGCRVNSNNVLTVDRRTVDFSGIAVSTSSTAYCNSDENVNFFTFVTAANKSDIEGSSNGWGYVLDGGGIAQCGGNNNTKTLCLQNSTPGTYNTVFTITKNSCVSTYNKTITVKPVPGATTLSPDVSNLCADGSATLTATTQSYVNSYTYSWYKDGALVRSGSTSRTHSYAAEGGVLQTTWKVAAVDNGCTGAISNEVTVNNNQPTMDAAFVKGSFTIAEKLQINLSNMVNVDVSSITITATQQQNGSVLTFTPTPTNNT